MTYERDYVSTQPAPQAGAAEVEKWVASLSNELDRETERAISQRDVFLKTGVSTASHGGSHDTCFSYIIRQHLTTFPLVPTEQPSQIIPQGLTPEEIRQYIIQSTEQPSQDAKDAAKWREHVGKLDALVAFCPTCCEGKVASADMTRDEVIFQCGRTSGKSEAARAAQAQTKVKQT